MIEGAGPHRGVEIGDGFFQRGRIEFEFAGKLGDAAGLDRREQRRHETVEDGRIEDDVGDLVGLRRHQPAPDRVALRPDVLALVVKTLRVLVDDDAEHHRIVPRDDAAVEFRRAGVDRHRMALRGIADVLHALGQQHLQDRAAIIGRAADQKVVGGVAPIFLQPFDVGFKTAGGGDQGRSAHADAAVALLQRCGKKHAVVDVEIEHFGIVEDVDAEAFRGQIERVQHRPSAAEEERIGAPETERAAERGLPAHALLDDPAKNVLGLRDHEAREFLVGLPAGDAQQIFPEFLFGIGAGEDVGRGIVGAAHVAGMAGIAAAIEFWGAFQHQHRGARPPRTDRGAQRRVAAADHQHVEFSGEVDHAPC